jgi:hypothetical protein
MRLALHRGRYAGLVVAAVAAVLLAACQAQPSPWSPEVDKTYKELYHPLIDGG